MSIKKNIVSAVAILAGLFLITALFLGFMKKDENILTEKNSVPVYFAKTYGENDYKLIVVRREFEEDESRIETAVDELLEGPTDEEKAVGSFTEVPEETKLIELRISPERVVINLSKEFGNGGGSSSITLRMEQLVNTVLDSAEERPVYLQLEGEQIKYLGGEGIMIPQPLSRNLTQGQEL